MTISKKQSTVSRHLRPFIYVIGALLVSLVFLPIVGLSQEVNKLDNNNLIDAYDYELRVKERNIPARELLPEKPPTTAKIIVVPNEIVANLNPIFIGYNIEDLSNSFFPGLYAQVLYGESFEDEPDVLLPKGWDAWLEPMTKEVANDPEKLRLWRGAWSFENGEVTLVGCRQRKIFTSDVQMTDGTVECEVMQPATERHDNGPGLLLCWKPSSYYHLYISPERNVVVLGKGTEARITQIDKTLKQVSLPLDYDRWYKLSATINKGQITVFLDGKEIFQVTDPEPFTGGIGLESAFCVSKFRNLTVTPEGKQTWKADFSLSDRPYTHKANISRWWDAIETGSAKARFTWSKENPYNTDRCQKIEMTEGKGTVGVYNTGLRKWGLTFRKEMTYHGRLYLRGNYDGDVTIALQSRDGSRTYRTQKFKGVTKDWKRFEINLPSNAEDTDARFAIWIDKPGTIFVDQVILMPGNDGLYKGLPIRRDLGEKLAAGMAHIRFGGDMINSWSFDWKKMLDPQDKRRQYMDGWNYHKSAQFMIFEFLDYCYAAGVEPIVNFGEHTPPEEIGEFAEYCLGSANTVWGKMRIENGRQAPYAIKYIMYGNSLPSVEYMRKAIEYVKKVDPNIKFLIGDVGHEIWTALQKRNPKFAEEIDDLAESLEAIGSRPEIPDLGSHYNWLNTIDCHTAGFPKIVSKGKPFLYAEEVNSHHHNMQRGLSDAIFTIVSENLGNKVWGQAFCTAIQASKNLYEWNEGHIHFNSAFSWYQPSGWIVKMLGENFQKKVLKTMVETPKTMLTHRMQRGSGTVEMDALIANATISDDQTRLVLKVVNLWGGPVATEINLGGLSVVSGDVTTIGTRHLLAENLEEDPNAIVPRSHSLDNVSGQMNHTFAPGTFTVITLKLKP